MRVLKNIFSQLHTFVLWLLASILFWGWIFTFVTDTVPAKKVTVYCRVPAVEDTAMAAAARDPRPIRQRRTRRSIRSMSASVYSSTICASISLPHSLFNIP